MTKFSVNVHISLINKFKNFLFFPKVANIVVPSVGLLSKF